MTEQALLRLMDTNLGDIEERCRKIREEMALYKEGVPVAWGFIMQRLLTMQERTDEAFSKIEEFMHEPECSICRNRHGLEIIHASE